MPVVTIVGLTISVEHHFRVFFPDEDSPDAGLTVNSSHGEVVT